MTTVLAVVISVIVYVAIFFAGVFFGRLSVSSKRHGTMWMHEDVVGALDMGLSFDEINRRKYVVISIKKYPNS